MSITEEEITLANRVVESLRRDILTGALEPGMKLRIDGLRQRYGVGASPIREALSQMVAEKLVLRIDHRGFRVIGADLAELEELIQTELIISVAALRASIQRGDVAWEERLVLAHRRLSLTPRSLDDHHYVPNPIWHQLHRAFHVALVDACGSRETIAICGDLHDRQTRFRILSNRITQWPRRDVPGEHRDITEAALAHDVDRACALLADHLGRTADFLRETLRASKTRKMPCRPSRPAIRDYVCSPPPRDSESQLACWEGLQQGVFDVFSSDHCPYRYEDEAGKLTPKGRQSFRYVPNGIPGIATRLPILFSEGVVKGRIDLNRFVALTSTNHAKRYGLYPQKGTIAIGSDADIVLWDPERQITITHSLLQDGCDYTPYEGLEVTGWPVRTMLRGKTICADGSAVAAGTGQLLVRAA